MFIRRSTYRRDPHGNSYANFRLVQSVRVQGRPRQKTLLNLGAGFDVPAEDWPRLCQLVETLATGGSLPPRAAPASLLQRARSLARQIVDFHGGPASDAPDLLLLDADSLRCERPRGVGLEHVALWALEQLGLPALLRSLGLSRQLRACALGAVIGRLAGVCSERATNRWLRSDSALGELLEVPFESLSHMQLYRASDALVRERKTIEKQLFDTALALFDLQPTVTLYDLTNTYFEGDAKTQPLAQRGHSKEKRSDCPLLTLAMVLDGSGFVRRSQVFAGNVQEAATLETMLDRLGAERGSLVVMDRGIATEQSLQWLDAQGYRYLAVSREGRRRFEQARAEQLETAAGGQVQVERVLSEDGQQVRLYCYSQEREKKERAIEDRRAQRFEEQLEKLHSGLGRPKARRKRAAIEQRLGRLQERSKGAAQHYEVSVETDASGELVTAVRWQRRALEGSRATHPGVYCLRSNHTGWDGATMWRTYVRLTDVEAVFRSLKSELGLRPVFHRKPERCEGHLFITVLAYQAVQVIRRKLQQQEQHASWASLRQVFATQRRVTTTMQCANGQTLHVRRTTQPEAELQELYQALGLEELPGQTCKLLL